MESRYAPPESPIDDHGQAAEQGGRDRVGELGAPTGRQRQHDLALPDAEAVDSLPGHGRDRIGELGLAQPDQVDDLVGVAVVLLEPDREPGMLAAEVGLPSAARKLDVREVEMSARSTRPRSSPR